MRKKKWTRERIIHDILGCEAQGRPLMVGEDGVSHALYQAGSRIFGSWRNAIQAAGISPVRANCGAKWPPAKILMIIRNLARRHRPLTTAQLECRFGSMLAAARRLFGSWSKAVMAAGVDPTKFQRVVPWTRERVIEAILIRALRNESLAARSTQPRSLVEAGQRFFGGWAAAMQAAGLDYKTFAVRPAAVPNEAAATATATGGDLVHRPGQPWTKEMVIASIQTRLRQQKPMQGEALVREDRPLYRAATRQFTSWREALRVAGVNVNDHRRGSGNRDRSQSPSTHEEPSRKSQVNDALRPDPRG